MENTLSSFLRKHSIQLNSYYENMYSFITWIECKRLTKNQSIKDFCKDKPLYTFQLLAFSSTAGMSRGTKALLERMNNKVYKSMCDTDFNKLHSRVFKIMEYLIKKQSDRHFSEDYYIYGKNGVLDICIQEC